MLSDPFANYGGSKNGYGEGLFGWRMLGGDLRAAHFLATHALHTIPLIGFLISRVWSGTIGVGVVRLVAFFYAAVVLWLTWSVIQGGDLPAIFGSPI